MGIKPLIIVGMHRSGTTMLSEILEHFGMFMGAKKEINNESVFFIKINDWIMRQINASWDLPYNFNFITPTIIDKLAKAVTKQLHSFKRIEFLGFEKYLKYKDLRNLDFPWGWKDPRTTFTIDVWAKIFPNPKIIHIYRNPIDVAYSLKKREEELDKTFKMTFKMMLKEYFLKGKIGYVSSLRLRDLKEGIKLWEEYVAKCLSLENTFDKNIKHIKYEDFLDNPIEILKDILNFSEISYNERKIEEIKKIFRKDRKYAFINNPHLVEIYKAIRDMEILKKLGYTNIPGL